MGARRGRRTPLSDSEAAQREGLWLFLGGGSVFGSERYRRAKKQRQMCIVILLGSKERELVRTAKEPAASLLKKMGEDERWPLRPLLTKVDVRSGSGHSMA